jgi:hypothetical protein
MSVPFAKRVKQRGWCGLDPGLIYANVYLNIMTYFLVEKLFAGNRHLGVSDDVAMENIVELVLRGVWKADPAKRDGPARSGKKLAGASSKASAKEVAPSLARATHKKERAKESSTNRRKT